MDENKESRLIPILLEVQRELSHARASQTNPHFKSSYVPFEELWDYAKDSLNWRGILIQQISHNVKLEPVSKLFCMDLASH